MGWTYSSLMTICRPTCNIWHHREGTGVRAVRPVHFSLLLVVVVVFPDHLSTNVQLRCWSWGSCTSRCNARRRSRSSSCLFLESSHVWPSRESWLDAYFIYSPLETIDLLFDDCFPRNETLEIFFQLLNELNKIFLSWEYLSGNLV